MPRPITLPFPSFFTEAGSPSTQPATQLDLNNSTLAGVINDSSSGWVNYAADSGVANAYVVTLTSAPLAYNPAFTIVITIANSNSGASTINANGLGTRPIVTATGAALAG